MQHSSSFLLPLGARRWGLATLGLILSAAGCHTASEGPVMSLHLTSAGFGANAEIPQKYTCEGADVSPPLAWDGAPSGTKAFALVVDDPDAPDPAAPKTRWVHWIAYNLPPTTSDLEEGAGGRPMPEGTLDGNNGWGKTGYRGPCPPIGRHRYFYKLYALDAALPELNHPDMKSLETAMQGHVLAQSTLIGTYQKKK